MSVVSWARDVLLDRDVAVPFPKPGIAADSAALEGLSRGLG
jgi:hypothetical protein